MSCRAGRGHAVRRTHPLELGQRQAPEGGQHFILILLGQRLARERNLQARALVHVAGGEVVGGLDVLGADGVLHAQA